MDFFLYGWRIMTWEWYGAELKNGIYIGAVIKKSFKNVVLPLAGYEFLYQFVHLNQEAFTFVMYLSMIKSLLQNATHIHTNARYKSNKGNTGRESWHIRKCVSKSSIKQHNWIASSFGHQAWHDMNIARSAA